MKKNSFLPKNEYQNSSQWLPIVDLMTGLMVFFLLVALSYMILNENATNELIGLTSKFDALYEDYDQLTSKYNEKKIEIDSLDKKALEVSQNYERLIKVIVEYNTSQFDLHRKLREEFHNITRNFNVEIIDSTLAIRFINDKDVLFNRGEFYLKPDFRNTLKEFFPKYIETLSSYNTIIEEIRIEGHTSSEWDSKSSIDEAYLNNMVLSHNRARSVLEFCIDKKQIHLSNKDLFWVKSVLTASGLSSSKLIFTRDGSEDKDKSRRVEFKIRTNSEAQMQKISKLQEKISTFNE